MATNNQRMTSIEDEQETFSKWFNWQIGVAFTIGVAVAGVVLWFTGQINPLNTQIALLNQSVENIKNNDLTHIELEISSINTQIQTFNDQQNIQNDKLTEILTILKK